MNHQTHLDLAISNAENSLNPKWRMACFLVDQHGTAVGYGVNSAPALSPPWTEHAEEAALQSMYDSEGLKFPIYAYVARVNRKNEGRLARPCENCAAQLKTAKVREVFWTGVNGELCSGVL